MYSVLSNVGCVISSSSSPDKKTILLNWKNYYNLSCTNSMTAEVNQS